MRSSERVTTNRARQVALALVITVLLPACGKVGGKGGRDCKPAGAAEVCLTSGSRPKLTASGLEPGSQVITAETKGDGKAPPQIPPIQAGPDGTFPSDGGSITFEVGGGPLTIFVTVTPRGGKPTTVTFVRE